MHIYTQHLKPLTKNSLPMSLQKLLDHLQSRFSRDELPLSKATGSEVFDAIVEYKKIQDEQYKKLKSEGKITFGKYKGYTVKEMCRTVKGKEYLSWLLTQSWFQEKFTDLVEVIKKEGIKKKTRN